eukprot:273313-Pyramimonas_sp.AAC.1
MEDGMLMILLDIGSSVNIVGLQTAQTFERVSRSRGHDTKKLNLSKRLYVWSGTRCRCMRQVLALQSCAQGEGHPAGTPAAPRLDTCSANVVEGSGEKILVIRGLRSMSNIRTILILEQGHEKMAIPCSEMYKLLLGK